MQANYWALALLFVISTSRQSHASNICFLKPYVTSATADAKLISPGTYNLSLHIELDYAKSFKLENIIVYFNSTALQLTVYSRGMSTRFISDENSIRYYRVQRGSLTKVDYLEHLRDYIRAVPKASYLFGEPCNPAFLRVAAYYPPYENTAGFLRVEYANKLRCVINGSHIIPIAEKREGVLSAAFSEQILVEFYIDSVWIRYFNEQPAIRIVPGINAVQVSPYIEFGIKSEDFFNSAGCANKAMPTNLLASTIDDFKLTGSFQTFTKRDGKFLAFLTTADKSFPQPVISWTYHNAEYLRNEAPSSALPWVHHPQNYTLMALTFLDNQSGVGHAFYSNHNISDPVRGLYIQYRGKNLIFTSLFTPVFPDDIVDWSPCRKIVMIYGLSYALFDHWMPLTADEVEWHLLDPSMFDYPIEAVHAEGHEFWFFTKAYTVQVMTASPDCTRLKLSMRHSIHYRQLFEKNISQVMLEGRYYDGQKWEPSWDYVPSIKEEENIQIWHFVLGGLALTAIFLIVILVYVLKRSETNRGDTIYSLNRSSLKSISHIQSKSQDLKRHEPASTLPLFSQHETLRRSTSSSSVGARKTVSPSRKSSKYLRNSPKKSKSKK